MENPYGGKAKERHPKDELPCGICDGQERAWNEGRTVAKAEQAEIVSGLVEAAEAIYSLTWLNCEDENDMTLIGGDESVSQLLFYLSEAINKAKAEEK